MFASTAFGQLRYIKEATAGVTPNTGTGVDLRSTGPTMKAAVQSIVSNEIRPERMVISSTNVDRTVDGGFDFELSAREYDPFIAAALGGTWNHFGTGGISSVPVSVTTLAGKISAASGPAGNDAFTKLVKGQWFKLVPDAGASTPVKNYFNDKWLRVSPTVSPTSTEITLDPATPLSGAGLISVAAPVKLSSSALVNGDARDSFTLEWAQTDITQFLHYTGMRVNTMSMDFSVGAMLTGSFGFFGMGHDITQTSVLPGGPNFTASQDGEVMNSVTDMGVLSVGSLGNLLAGGTSFIQKVSLEINNNLRGQKALGIFGNAGVGYGELAISGTMECYFQDEDLYTLANEGGIVSLSLGVADVLGNGYLLDMPKVKFKDASLNLGNKDSDVMLSLPFQAFYDLNEKRGISIYRAVSA